MQRDDVIGSSNVELPVPRHKGADEFAGQITRSEVENLGVCAVDGEIAVGQENVAGSEDSCCARPHYSQFHNRRHSMHVGIQPHGIRLRHS